MERLYNPDQMPEAEIKETFVARQHVVDELVSLIKHQPDGAGVQQSSSRRAEWVRRPCF